MEKEGSFFISLRYRAIALGDIFLPRECAVCGRVLLSHESHICIWCLEDLPQTWFWLRKRNIMADRFNAMVQRRVVEDEAPEPYSYAAALFFYRNGTGYEKITQRLKYHSDIPEGRFFGRMLGNRLSESEHFRDASLVIPVPLHPLRRWRRGFNQAEVIAKEVAEALGAELCTHILKRRRMTKTQTRLSVEEKSRNVATAFAVNRKALSARLEGSSVKHIILVDDVFTTGATLNACHAALRRSLASLGIAPGRCRISVVTLGYVGGI